MVFCPTFSFASSGQTFALYGRSCVNISRILLRDALAISSVLHCPVICDRCANLDIPMPVYRGSILALFFKCFCLNGT